MKTKQAISLIVLVITIIVMIILTGTILLTIDGIGIIPQSKQAVKDYDLAEVQTLAGLKWTEAYLDGKDITNIEGYILTELENEGVQTYKYDIAVEDDGVIVTLSNANVTAAPEQWRANVIKLVDNVPIPKGFVASQATGENTKNGGLVIYEGTEQVNDANVETAKRTRNQYVWVPVEDFSKFVRQNFGKSISNTLGSNYWEVVLDTTTNMPLATQNTNYMSAETLAEVQAMYESVKEYKGFYIARYEAGIDAQRTEEGNAADLPGIKEGTTVYSVMGKIPYNYIPWTWNNSMSEDTNGAVEVARRMYPATNTNYGVVSTLTYGVQWDRTLAWWVESQAQNATKTVTIASNDNLNNSTNYGNYYNRVIAAGDLNDGAKYTEYSFDSVEGPFQETTVNSTKAYGTHWLLSTGALKAASVNNIYDMAGNVREWTMEGEKLKCRVMRGGDSYMTGVYVSYRSFDFRPGGGVRIDGFRPSLYIKK